MIPNKVFRVGGVLEPMLAWRQTKINIQSMEQVVRAAQSLITFQSWLIREVAQLHHHRESLMGAFYTNWSLPCTGIRKRGAKELLLGGHAGHIEEGEWEVTVSW